MLAPRSVRNFEHAHRRRAPGAGAPWPLAQLRDPRLQHTGGPRLHHRRADGWKCRARELRPRQRDRGHRRGRGAVAPSRPISILSVESGSSASPSASSAGAFWRSPPTCCTTAARPCGSGSGRRGASPVSSSSRSRSSSNAAEAIRVRLRHLQQITRELRRIRVRQELPRREGRASRKRPRELHVERAHLLRDLAV